MLQNVLALIAVMIMTACAHTSELDGLYVLCPPGYDGDEWLRIERGIASWHLPSANLPSSGLNTPFRGRAYLEQGYLYFELDTPRADTHTDEFPREVRRLVSRESGSLRINAWIETRDETGEWNETPDDLRFTAGALTRIGTADLNLERYSNTHEICESVPP